MSVRGILIPGERWRPMSDLEELVLDVGRRVIEQTGGPLTMSELSAAVRAATAEDPLPPNSMMVGIASANLSMSGLLAVNASA